MGTIKLCPGCHKPLLEGAPDGLCPECLMKAGLGTDVDIESETYGESQPKPPSAPSPEAIGVHFPLLEILELLGHGGMGTVYKARQPHLNRLVALKILATDKGQDPAFAERFTREAQMLARLNHPNIVTLYDFGKVDGLYYLLMEYVDGVSLRQLLQSKKLTPEEALAIVPKICEALQYAHEHGVVHRDIKPENVLLNQEGRVKIADFGIAKMVGVEAGQPAITKEQQVIGTPHYMAPEQVEHPKQVDHRADIYSLGVVFYEMLTGELPLGKFPPPSRKVQIDVRLDEIVLHALEKEPERRYQQASQVKTDVEGVAHAPPPPPTPEHSEPKATTSSGRIPGTHLCLVEFRHGRKLVNWQNAILAWCLLMLLGVLILGPIALLAGLFRFYISLEAFQTAGVTMACFYAFVIGVAVRRALLSPSAAAETPASRTRIWPLVWILAVGLLVVLGLIFGLWTPRATIR